MSELVPDTYAGRRVMLKTLSIVGYLGMLAGVLGLVATRALFSPSPLVIAGQVLALVLFLWARVTFGRRSFHAPADPTEGGLVTVGPYRFIRHPIYTAFCLFTSTGGLAHASWSAALFAATVVISAVLRMMCEEALVAARYPEYAQYAATTWRMIPYVF